MPYADLPGVHLWYTDSGGDGVPVAFLHAASGNADSWAYQLPAFTAAGYRCIAYDRRGWGRSRADPVAEQPGYASDDLHGLADHLGLGPLHLVATAAGGAGAVDYALSHPEPVRSLVVADATAGVQEPEYLEAQSRHRPQPIAELPVELRELSAGYRALNAEGVRRWVEIAHASRQQGWEGQRPRNQVTYSLLQTLRASTLVLVGEADMATPPATARLYAAHIPNCRFATVPEAGHGSHWEQPEAWNRLVLEFIRQH